MSLIRRLFHFGKPAISRLDYTDIVIEDKMLLLLSWEFPRPLCLRILSPRRSWYGRAGSVALKIPAGADHIHITISTMWRRKKIIIPLKRVHLDKSSASWLIRQFNPMMAPLLLLKEAGYKKTNPVPAIPGALYTGKTPSFKTASCITVLPVPAGVQYEKLTYPE